MIARATLALMLAGSASAALAMAPNAAAAHNRRPVVPPEPTTVGREKTAHAGGHRRVRSLLASVHRSTRRENAAPAVAYRAASYDDGLAYDTPRSADGRPLLMDAMSLTPVTRAFSGSGQAGSRGGAVFQTGMASWYGGSRWQGRSTSSGDRYDENALTAAHATLPLGSRVRVRLVNSEREVVVTITDRPGTRRRIIDLSRGAASALGMLSSGLARVSLEPL